MDTEKLCPCCSGKNYADCCAPLHQGRAPSSALALMRSRYSAYALNLPDYIIATTHPASPQFQENKFSWKRAISRFSKNSTFLKLEILDFQEQNTMATVTFTVYLSQEGQDGGFTERSYFDKKAGRWLYRCGVIEEGHAPNLVTTGQLRLLPLAYYGDAVLSKKAEPIGEITEDMRKLVEEMVETMDAYGSGIGLAAPQVHHSIRLFITRIPIEKEGRRVCGELEIYINPILLDPSTEREKELESCLSIPTIRCPVERPKEITVRYINLEGKQIEKRLSGLEARCIQHEYDHIEGILTVDRATPQEKKELENSLKNLKQRLHDDLAL